MVKATEITFTPGYNELEDVLVGAVREIVSSAEHINRVCYTQSLACISFSCELV